MAREKRPKLGAEPAPVQKVPRTPAHRVRGHVVSWRFAFADRDGPFAWSDLSDPQFKTVIERLREFEQMDERAFREAGSHFIETHQFSKAARDRLQAIQLDDLDGLFSLRIQGKPRVFCRIDGGHFDVLWWDPEHAVCPAPLKHT